MFPSHLFEDDSLVWGLCPSLGSAYSQASAQPCSQEQCGTSVRAEQGSAGQPGLPLPPGVQSLLLPCSQLQKSPTAGQICNANGKRHHPSHSVTMALTAPACFLRATPLLQESAPAHPAAFVPHNPSSPEGRDSSSPHSSTPAALSLPGCVHKV